jgi:hypothetical protein
MGVGRCERRRGRLAEPCARRLPNIAAVRCRSAASVVVALISLASVVSGSDPRSAAAQIPEVDGAPQPKSAPAQTRKSAGVPGAKPAPSPSAQRTVLLPITIHVAESGGVPVVDEAFIAARVERANEIFATYGVQFAVRERKSLPERNAALENRADRDALGAYFARGTVHVFCVASLRDVDEPDRMRRGVHWRSVKHPGAHFVIVSSIAGVDVLAHELGHYLGNPEHSEVAGNLMSYEHTDVTPFLDEAQAMRLRRRLRTYLESRELVPLRAPNGEPRTREPSAH